MAGHASGEPGLRWDDVLAAYLTPEQRSRLASARVGLAGAGGLGSNCALLLARSGIGSIVAADCDLVSLSNLNRQHFLPDHVGKPKVAALAEMLRAVNPCLRLESHRLKLDKDNAPALFADCDLVVEAVDDAATKRMLLEILTLAGLFVVGASGVAGWGGPGMRVRRFGDRAVIVGDGISAVNAHLPPLAPRVMMAAAMQADQVLLHLLGPCPDRPGGEYE
jgi:sulfur carrier protein ThiS adenylyltransferase